VFNRTSWHTDAGWYSLRFGPPRQIHGHEDHTALMYMRGGREWLIDAGTPGYEQSSYRRWVISPEAHNVVVAKGAGAFRNVATALDDARVGARAQAFALDDAPYAGVMRSRRVLHVNGPNALFIVVDRLRDAFGRPLTYEQLWHLPEDVTVSRSRSRSAAKATKDGRTFHVVQVHDGTVRTVTGAIGPYQGWRSRTFRERTPAPTVVTSAHGASATFITVLADVASTRHLTARWTAVNGRRVLRVEIGNTTQDFTVGTVGPRRAPA
jgi:hypothetical protein